MKRHGKPGKRVRTLEQLHALTIARRAVVCPNSRTLAGPLPASFMLNLNGDVLRRLFASGMHEYRKQEAA